jgi:hypothetical protein
MSVLQSAHEADALDLRTLCAAIDEFPGIVTTCSYQDLVGGHRPGTSWTVHFSCGEAPTRQGYASLEFLVWLQREARAAGFSDLFVGVNAPPPYLNSALPLLLPALFEGSPGRARNPHPRPAPQAVHSSISQRPRGGPIRFGISGRSCR